MSRVYLFRSGTEHNETIPFQAILSEEGKRLAEYNFWLHLNGRVLTSKVDTYERRKGFASEIIRRTIPGELERIAQEHGPFVHEEEFTPQGEKLRGIYVSLGYEPKGNKLIKNYPQAK